ncbi:MAG: hypothetical protein RLP44_10960 [Aggregatilineales bacterium]
MNVRNARENTPGAMINSWIMTLQGSGDSELNRIVNDLVQLRRQLMSTPLGSLENQALIGRITTTANQIRNPLDPRYVACIQQVQALMQEFKRQ